MYLIVGLGNPEKDYANTRHNMGFEVINLLAEKYNIEVNKNKFKSLYGDGFIEGEKVILLKVHKCEFPTGEPLDESYEGVYECQDGHIVKSIAEQTIDDELYSRGIFHAYEAPLDIGEEKPLKPDFCLKNYLGNNQDVYIEYFGLKGQPKYDEHTRYKMEHYRKKGITLICLYPKDSKNLKFALQSKVFNKEKIKLGNINFEEE